MIWTIGHSTRPLAELIAALRAHSIELVVDVRHFPGSRKFPWFGKESLEVELPKAGIAYRWMESLGGFRKGGYEAYMGTAEFAKALSELEQLAKERRTAFLCAEVLWWRCHRRHIADALASKGWEVAHIFTDKKSEGHRALPARRVACEPKISVGSKEMP